MSENQGVFEGRDRRWRLATAFAAGAVFAVGLALAGMTQPGKVVAFLDFLGDWDPSLAFVMGGAILVYATLHRRILKRTGPLLDPGFRLPTLRKIDVRLVAGAALFGVGWGLGGFCPGPALASLGTGAPSVAIFVAAMITGMFLYDVYDRVQGRRRSDCAR